MSLVAKTHQTKAYAATIPYHSQAIRHCLQQYVRQSGVNLSENIT